MPRAAIERGYANRIVSLEALASTLIMHCGSLRSVPAKEQYPVRSAGRL